MNPEQLIRESLAAFNAHDEKKAYSNFADDLVVNNFMPQPIGLEEFKALNAANLAAFPDWHFDIKQIQTQGDKATVTVQVSGTQNGPINFPGMPSIPASGKKVSVRTNSSVLLQPTTSSIKWILIRLPAEALPGL